MNKYNAWARKKGYSGLILHNGKAYGVWMLGQRYMNQSDYYGAYPAGYVERFKVLFQDLFENGRILHLFSGSIKGDCDRVWTVDIDPDVRPCVVASADAYADKIPSEVKFDLIFADPPYKGNWEKYPKAKKVSARKVLEETYKVAKEGAYLIWLDTHFPQFSRRWWDLAGIVGIVTSTNRVIRGSFIFRRMPKNAKLD